MMLTILRNTCSFNTKINMVHGKLYMASNMAVITQFSRNMSNFSLLKSNPNFNCNLTFSTKINPYIVSLRKYSENASPVAAAGDAAAPKSFYLPKAEVEQRIIHLLKNFGKIKPEDVTTLSHFKNDLGLDSLDEVELSMVFEDEFCVEIPDIEAEKIKSVPAAVAYICTNPNAK